MQTLADLVFLLRDQWTGRMELLAIRRKRRTESLSGGELVAATHSLALSLESRGVSKGDRVAIFAENCPEWHMIDFACHLLGAVSVPIFPNLPADQVSFIVKNSGTQWLFYRSEAQRRVVEEVVRGLAGGFQFIGIEDERLAGTQTATLTWLLGEGSALRSNHSLERFRDRVQPQDLASLVYTSGTTGEPKAVALSHQNLVSNLHACANRYRIGPEDRALSFLPLAHAFERTLCHVLLYRGASIHYVPKIEQVSLLMPQVQPTVLSSVPRLYERIHRSALNAAEAMTTSKRRNFDRALEVGSEYLDAKDRGFVNPVLSLRRKLADRLVFQKLRLRLGGQLRLAISSGAPLSAQVEEFFDVIGLPVLQTYGLTEASPALSASVIQEKKRGSVGKPLAQVEVKIANDDEILARSPGVMIGYWENEDATGKALQPDGWLKTGDIGRLDSSGFLFVSGRKQELITNPNGVKISPQPIELALTSGKWISQAFVVGDGHPYLTALLVPNFERVESVFKILTTKALLETPAAIERLEREVQKTNAALPEHERIRDWTLLPQPLSVASGDLTPTLKLKRRHILRKFDRLVQSLYPENAQDLARDASSKDSTTATASPKPDSPAPSSGSPNTTSSDLSAPALVAPASGASATHEATLASSASESTALKGSPPGTDSTRTPSPLDAPSSKVPAKAPAESDLEESGTVAAEASESAGKEASGQRSGEQEADVGEKANPSLITSQDEENDEPSESPDLPAS